MKNMTEGITRIKRKIQSRPFILFTVFLLTLASCSKGQQKHTNETVSKVNSVSFEQTATNKYRFSINADSLKRLYNFIWPNNINLNLEFNRDQCFYYYKGERHVFLSLNNNTLSQNTIYYYNTAINKQDSFKIRLVALHHIPKYSKDTFRIFFIENMSIKSIPAYYGILLVVDNNLNIRTLCLGYLEPNYEKFLYTYSEGDMQYILNKLYLRCIRYTGIQF